MDDRSPYGAPTGQTSDDSRATVEAQPSSHELNAGKEPDRPAIRSYGIDPNEGLRVFPKLRVSIADPAVPHELSC
jgi:hypothetical protein